MRWNIVVLSLDDCRAETMLVFFPKIAFDRNAKAKQWDKLCGGKIRDLFYSGEFTGGLNECEVLHLSAEAKFKRLIMVGLGSKAEIGTENYRQASGTISKSKNAAKSSSLSVYIDSSDEAIYAQPILEGLLLGSFKIGDYKTGSTNDSFPGKLTFCCRTKAVGNKVSRFAERGKIIGEQAILTRRLASLPANDLTPKKFVAIAQKESKKYGVNCKALDEKQIKSENMAALYGVAKGSVEPPRFLIMKYDGAPSNRKPIVLLGKGITFDAGGISLKPSLDMHQMKSDMSGGAAVVGAVIAIARLGLKQNVVGLVPLAENLPSGTAQKPGDIVNSRKGKTIEIINTDAEGRLILADGLDYANEFNPQAVIDICTLTGGATYILGYGGALLMGNNDKLKALIKNASDISAERTWELPLWQEYSNWMESEIADLRNSGGKWGTSITAGAFLKAFVGNWPWAHIDIASVDYMPALKAGHFSSPYIPKGYTGFGMRLLVELVANWKRV